MRTSDLLRWGGLCALVGGLIGIAGETAFLFAVGDHPYSLAALTIQWSIILVTMMLSTILSTLGLVALYARQASRAGRLGVTSFVVATMGAMMILGHQWSSAFVIPVLANGTPGFLDAMVTDTTTVLAGGVLLSLLLMSLGWLLFGVASLRAGILPLGPAYAVILGAVLYLFLNLFDLPLDGVVLYIGWAWMGGWLWSRGHSNHQ